MLENATLARPYAQAVFEEGTEKKSLGTWSTALACLSAIVADADMRRVLNDPRVDRAKKEKLLFEVAGDSFDAAAKNFVRVLLDGGRVLVTPDIAVLFEQMKARTEGKVEVEVVSAYALEAEQEGVIADAVKRRVGKEVDIKSTVDPALVGGVIIRIGDTVIDASLRGRLKQLATGFS